MKKVMVIGSPWAGKSTFERKMRDAAGLPLFYLDMIWHKPDQTRNVSVEESDRRLGEIVEKAFQVLRHGFGRKREDMPWTETEFEEEFRQWILDFPEKQLPQIYKMLEQYGEVKKLVIFHTREEADLYFSSGISDKWRRIRGKS